MVKVDDVFDCEMGGITVWKAIRIRDHKPFGLLTFAQVLAKSSNVGVIKAALRSATSGFTAPSAASASAAPPGIDLPGESGGILHPLERWGPLGKAYVSFGQGISVTPLQLVAATAAVANDGDAPASPTSSRRSAAGGEGAARATPAAGGGRAVRSADDRAATLLL